MLKENTDTEYLTICINFMVEIFSKEVNISVLGLIFDIVGAFWLAKAIIWRSKRQIELETTSFYDSNPYQRQAQDEAKYYGWFGFILLSLGFMVQILGEIIYIKLKTWIILLFIAVLLSVGYFLNKFIKRRSSKNIPKEFKDKYGNYSNKRNKK